MIKLIYSKKQIKWREKNRIWDVVDAKLYGMALEQTQELLEEPIANIWHVIREDYKNVISPDKPQTGFLVFTR